MIFGRVAGRLRRRWRRALAAAVAASVLSGGGITAYSSNFDHLIGRVLGGIGLPDAGCVESPTGPTVCADGSPARSGSAVGGYKGPH